MQDIILYAVLTIVVGGLLYSVLGKDVGQDLSKKPNHDPQKSKGANDVLESFLGSQDNSSKQDVRRPASPVFKGPAAEGLGNIYAADPTFNLPQFLDGAKGAYGMILEAFSSGDKETLEALLTDEVKDIYFSAIDDLNAKGLSQRTDLARLIDAEVVSAEKNGKIGTIQVSYHAELATALVDKYGNVVKGDLDVLSRVREIWSYERVLKDKNPNWRLSGVEPHSSSNPDMDGPDHSPDT